MTLPVYHIIDSGVPGPHLLITAGVHGDEFEPIVAASRLATQMRGIVSKGKTTIVPVTNNSAYETGERLGRDGLDLARVCPGNAAGSTTERAAHAVSQLIRTADFYIDLHNGGRLFDIMPLAGYMLHASTEVLEKQRAMAKAFQLPLVWGTEASPDGRTLSVARDANVPAIYVEYGGGDFFSAVAAKEIQEGCARVIDRLGMTAAHNHPVDDAAVRYIVEDYKAGAGHLQVKMPSPADGIFIPSVKLGNIVRREQVWGVVCNPGIHDEIKVYADRDGLAFFIRAYPRVKAGESLGGILEV